MTAQTRSVNKARFENGDKPSGSQFSDLIDSFLSIADSTAQSVTSDVEVPNLDVVGHVSAGTLNVIGTASVSILLAENIVATRLEATTAKFTSGIHTQAIDFGLDVTASVSASNPGGTVLPANAAGYIKIKVSAEDYLLAVFEGVT